MSDQPRKPYHSTARQWGQLKPLARTMRHEPTEAEEALWQALRNRKVDNAKFRRQYSIGPFVVDFYCVEVKLVVEVDGGIHDHQQATDQTRQSFLEAQGMTVLRFRNEEILNTIEHVLACIREALQKR